MILHFNVHGVSVTQLQQRKFFKGGECVVVPVTSEKDIKFVEIRPTTSQLSEDDEEATPETEEP